jgi:ATP-dependent Clp protease adaptor protein ClpS
MSKQTILKDNTKVDIKKPKMYKVLIHNDNYTTMEFVIEVIVKIFHKGVAEATKIMFDVHNKGQGTVGMYPYDIAATKVLQVEAMAKARNYPLKSSYEEE